MTMNQQVLWVGIDVSKLKLDVAAQDARGKVKSRVFRNDAAGLAQLDQWLRARALAPDTTRLCMEATGPYSETVATTLSDRGWTLSVVNPARVKGYAQGELSRNKTDRADASLLMRFGAALHPEAWQPAALEVRQLRAWVDRLQALKDMHQQEANRLEACLASEQEEALRQSIEEHLQWLSRRMRELERQIDDHLDGHPRLREDAQLLQSIPGVGRATTAKVLAYLGDVRRFDTAKALSAFIGVSPRLRLSGSSVKGRSGLCRTGHAFLRQALYMPAMVALKHNPAVQCLGLRLKACGLAPKAVIGAAMRKLVCLIYGVLRSGKPFDANLAMPRLDVQDGI